MKFRTARALVLAMTPLLCSSLPSAALAQPKLVITGIQSDLSRTGNSAVGFGYDASIFEYATLTWTRGVGFTRVNGAFPQDADVSCSNDLSALLMMTENVSDWGALNCFNGYYWSQEDLLNGHTLGDPRPPQNPCSIASISHRWTQASGWVNTGSFTRTLDPITGRWYGGTRCDAGINYPADLSGNGRYAIANGWVAQLTTDGGTPGFGLCDDFLPFRYDSVSTLIQPLPVQAGTTTARADRVNDDGSVITGHDLGIFSNGLGGFDSIRRTCVWRHNGSAFTQTILDPHFGAKDNAGINGPGNVLASGASTQFVQSTFSQSGVRLVKWTWNGSAYVPTNLGRPVDYLDPILFVPIPFSDLWVTGISDDGNTIVGTALYGEAPPSRNGIFRSFIWRQGLNGSVPLDLETYINAQSPGNPLFPSGFQLSRTVGLSADGNAILIQIFDGRNTCTNGETSLPTFRAGILYLNGASIPCDAPRIGLHPQNWAESNFYNFGTALNVVASGSWPLNYQWQREDPNAPGTWLNLVDSCAGFYTGAEWDFEGTNTVQLRIGQSPVGAAGRSGRYRVIISNACGTVTSDPATVTHALGACCATGGYCEIKYAADCLNPALTFQGVYVGDGTLCEASPCDARACCTGTTCNFIDRSGCQYEHAGVFQDAGTFCSPGPCAPACTADFNGTDGVTADDIFAFLDAWFAQNGQTGPGFSADFNGVDGVTADDIFAFLDAWFAQNGVCS